MERASGPFRPRGFVNRVVHLAPVAKLFCAPLSSHETGHRLLTHSCFFRGLAWPKLGRRLAFALFVALASLLAYAHATRTTRGAYSLADDCPRGALVYAQASDLPALLRLWDKSKLKEKYLASANFAQFQKGHVALKLGARLSEFDAALGFPLDAAVLADATEQEAALAVYDIGRMELVFIAPVSETKAQAARFFQAADGFDQTELPDGTVYYSHDVEADRGRQKQKILFACASGRFILATGEQLMLRTLANINGKSRADRLSDDPSFKALSGAVTPHLFAVWVDQAKLNGDYYFKHYWAMSDTARLGQLRAGLFDFELRADRLLEHREFLTQAAARPVAAPPLQDLRELTTSIPQDAVYARVRVLDKGGETAAALLGDALFDRLPADEQPQHAGGLTHEDFDPADETGDDWDSYSSSGDAYDQPINEPSNEESDAPAAASLAAASRARAELARVLDAAQPVAGALAESPRAQDGPLFVEFRRSAAFTLHQPGALDRQAFEHAIEALIVGRLTVAGDVAGLKWTDGGAGARSWRELVLPMLGWKLCYALRGRQLFVSNDAAFLAAALDGGRSNALRPPTDAAHAPDDLTLIRFDRRAQAFDRVFQQLDAQRIAANKAERDGQVVPTQASAEFFTGNVASLLDAAASVASIEISRRSTPGRLHEEVEVLLSGDGAPAPSP